MTLSFNFTMVPPIVLIQIFFSRLDTYISSTYLCVCVCVFFKSLISGHFLMSLLFQGELITCIYGHTLQKMTSGEGKQLSQGHTAGWQHRSLCHHRLPSKREHSSLVTVWWHSLRTEQDLHLYHLSSPSGTKKNCRFCQWFLRKHRSQKRSESRQFSIGKYKFMLMIWCITPHNCMISKIPGLWCTHTFSRSSNQAPI